MKCNPRKWLYGVPLAALPFIAALWLNSAPLERKLTDAAAASLAGIKADWAKLSLDGRDARLEGEAPGLKAIEDAAKAVAGTEGVRRVDAALAKVVLAPPTLAPLVTNNNLPEIKGTWPEIFAKTLKVILPERSYVLGTDPEVKTDGAGNWTFIPAQPLKDGGYDVSVEVDDGAGNSSKIAAPARIVIDTVPPPMPVFSPFKGAVSPQSLSGSWAEGDAATLKVELAGKTHTLGDDPDLTSSSGTWTLALPEPLPEGVYDLAVEAVDQAGNSARLNLPEAVTISTVVPAPTVAKYSGNNATPLISGTWSEMQGSKLAVAIGGKTYELGRDAELSSDGFGNWKLRPSGPLKDGIYDAVVTVTDAMGKVTKDETVAEIEIDATGPAAPTVNMATGLPVTGTFAPGDTKLLRVTVARRSYTLGRDAALTAKGEIWTLAPPEKLPPGTYDVIVEAVDAFGNVSADTGKGALVIEADATTPPPPPPPPPAATAPTVTPLVSLAARPTIAGTFTEGATKSLKVSVAGESYVLGTNEELTASAGQWSLKLPNPLKDGTYDVAVETTDGDGKIVTDNTKDELVIDAMGPASPTVNLYAMLESPRSLSGTWPEGDATSLVVTFNGKSWTLGKDAGLTSAQGNWSLAVPETLEPGSYDVGVVATDRHGRSSSDQTRFEILVKEPPPPPDPPPPPEPPPPPPPPPPPEPPPPPPPPEPPPPPQVNCVDDFAKTLLARPLHFDSDKSAVTPAAEAIIKDLAAIARTCPQDRLEVGGYTDSIGSPGYNQALSERRAVAVAHALAGLGIARERLTAIGYGEKSPVADNNTELGRALNRRIEIKIVK